MLWTLSNCYPITRFIENDSPITIKVVWLCILIGYLNLKINQLLGFSYIVLECWLPQFLFL